MKLVHSSAEIIKSDNPYKLVEAVGRICYKSEDKITDESYKKFVQGLISRQHFAMLEHGRVNFMLYGDDCPTALDIAMLPGAAYSIVSTGAVMLVISLSHLYNPKWQKLAYVGPILDDVRKEVESIYLNDDSSEDTPAFPHSGMVLKGKPKWGNQYTSIKFVCDRGVSHELVRHRVSVAQSSTRYCNYSKDKFGNEITCVYPNGYDEWSIEDKTLFEETLHRNEWAYMQMIHRGYTPQQARALLPNSLMTEVVLTMSNEHWKHFFNLGYFGTTGAPHPDMKEVAEKAYILWKEECPELEE